MDLKSFLPPFIFDLALAATRTRHGFKGDYETFEDALADSTSYEADAVVDQYKQQLINNLSKKFPTKNIDDRSLRLLGALTVSSRYLESNKLSIIDYGGGYGNHYFNAFSHIKETIFNYVVCESDAVVKELSKIEAPFSFTSNLNNFKESEFDLAVASCVLPYLPDPYGALSQLTKISKWIILDRMPILDSLSNDVISKQFTTAGNGKKISYPARFFSQEELLKQIEFLGLNLVAEWQVPEDRPFFNGTRKPYVGYLLEKRH